MNVAEKLFSYRFRCNHQIWAICCHFRENIKKVLISSEQTAKRWSSILLPHGTQLFRATCPFCAIPLDTSKPFIRLIYQVFQILPISSQNFRISREKKVNYNRPDFDLESTFDLVSKF